MDIDIRTHEIFISSKCGLISMSKNEHVYDSPSGRFIFFYPKENKMTINKILEINEQTNMPIVSMKEIENEWSVSNNEELEIAVDIIVNNY